MISKISIEKIEILDTGSIIQYRHDLPISITIKESDGTLITCRFEFLLKPEIQNDFVHISPYDVDTVNLQCQYKFGLSNFGAIEPIRIGTFDNEPLFFNFRANINGPNENAIIHYSWYITKEETI